MRISFNFPFDLYKNSTIKDNRLQIFIKYDIVPEVIINKELKEDILKDSFVPPCIERKIIFNYKDFKEKEKKLIHILWSQLRLIRF